MEFTYIKKMKKLMKKNKNIFFEVALIKKI